MHTYIHTHKHAVIINSFIYCYYSHIYYCSCLSNY